MALQIFVSTTWGQTLTIDIERTDTVKDLKKKIYLKTGISHFEQFFYGTLIREWTANDEDIVCNHIQKESTLKVSGGRLNGLLVFIDDKNYIDKVFLNYLVPTDVKQQKSNGQTVKELKNQVIKYLKYDKHIFQSIYEIYFCCSSDNSVISLRDNEYLWRDKYGNYYGSDTQLSQYCHIKSKEGKVWFKQNERKRCVLLVFGHNREIEEKYTFNIPFALNKLCEAYYHGRSA